MVNRPPGRATRPVAPRPAPKVEAATVRSPDAAPSARPGAQQTEPGSLGIGPPLVADLRPSSTCDAKWDRPVGHVRWDLTDLNVSPCSVRTLENRNPCSGLDAARPRPPRGQLGP